MASVVRGDDGLPAEHGLNDVQGHALAFAARDRQIHSGNHPLQVGAVADEPDDTVQPLCMNLLPKRLFLGAVSSQQDLQTRDLVLQLRLELELLHLRAVTRR